MRLPRLEYIVLVPEIVDHDAHGGVTDEVAVPTVAVENTDEFVTAVHDGEEIVLVHVAELRRTLVTSVDERPKTGVLVDLVLEFWPDLEDLAVLPLNTNHLDAIFVQFFQVAHVKVSLNILLLEQRFIVEKDDAVRPSRLRLAQIIDPRDHENVLFILAFGVDFFPLFFDFLVEVITHTGRQVFLRRCL